MSLLRALFARFRPFATQPDETTDTGFDARLGRTLAREARLTGRAGVFRNPPEPQEA